MKRISYPLYYLLHLTWGILQNIVGFIMYISLIAMNPKRGRFRFNGAFVIGWDSDYSAGIGMFIFIGKVTREYFTGILSHEYGHTIQSCILGPFYLFVIGIPSFIWAHGRRFNMNRMSGKYRYSDFYPERWANHLGRRFTGIEPISY